MVDLDPTSNNQLHLDLWDRLRHRLSQADLEFAALQKKLEFPKFSVPVELTEERKFGMDMRRLLTIIIAALLNPSEQKKPIVKFSKPYHVFF